MPPSQRQHVLSLVVILTVVALMSTSAQVSNCGGVFGEYDHGILTSPNYPNYYDNSLHCRWTIKSGGHAIRLTFEPPFELENSHGCVDDYVKVYSGEDTLAGLFCGHTLPPVMGLIADEVLIVFNSDSKVAGRGMSVMWQKIVPLETCDKELTQPQNFSSPQAVKGNNYHDSKTCTWRLHVDNGYFVGLRFSQFDLGSSTEPNKPCTGDILEIFDVFTNNSMIQRGEWCGTDMPPFIVSMTRTLVIRMTTDQISDNNGLGFTASFNKEVNCSYSFESSQGYFMSPYYPNSYSDSYNCSWTITVPPGYLSQLHLDIPSVNCTAFEVVEHTPNSGRIRDFKDWCHNEIFTSRTTAITISQLEGFDNKLFGTWTTVCGYSFNQTLGNLSTIGFPARYDDNMDCRWEIHAPENHVIKITFDPVFHIEASETGCDYDYGEIFDTIKGDLVSRGRFCGHSPPPSLVSYYPPVVVKFHSDHGKNGRGFSLSWNAEDACGEVFDASNGSFSYPNSVAEARLPPRCTWYIRVDEWFDRIRLDFPRQTFNMPWSTLQIVTEGLQSNDITDITANRYKQLYGGDRIVMAAGQRLKIEYNERHTNHIGGFHVNWNAECGGYYRDSRVVIKSPYFEGAYPGNLECEWTLQAQLNHVVHLRFNSTFDLEHVNDGSCRFDFVEVYDSDAFGRKALIGKFCGSQAPPVLVSKYQKMVVRFHSDNEKSGKGFLATWDTACGEHFHGDKGEITTPRFLEGENYPNAMDCTWIIEASEGTAVRLSFDRGSFSLEKSDPCTYDYVEVYDYTEDMQSKESLGRVCGQNPPPLITSKTNKMAVVFHSDSTKNFGGFKATWDSVCGAVMHRASGHFTSPQYPDGYPDNLDCRWEINVAKGQGVRLTFDPNFDLEMEQNNCGYDRVEVLDSFSNGSLISRGTWCSVTDTPVFVSFSSKLTVRFHSDMDKSGRGFNASWTSVGGCNNSYSSDTGYVMSRNYPDDYEENSHCQWTILPQGVNITLTFDPLFELEDQPGCVWDYVEVVEGQNKLGRWCGRSVPYQLTTNSPIQIVFRSDKSHQGRGFFASWRPSSRLD